MSEHENLMQCIRCKYSQISSEKGYISSVCKNKYSKHYNKVSKNPSKTGCNEWRYFA